MTDEKPDHTTNPDSPSDLSRREFVALTVAAGLAAAATSVSAAELPVVEQNVEVKTADGTCDAVFIHPTTGSHPGVLIWPDAFGLRPSMRDIGKRIAAEGYSVLVPNPFYRVAKAPVFQDPSSFSFQNQADMAKLQPLMASINAPGAAEKDAVAFIAFLDGQPQVNKAKKIGTQGYCMAARSWSRRLRPLRTAWVRARHSTAEVWSPTSRTVRICSRRRSKPACILGSPRMTTCGSPTPRTS
jgi:hypothetical protein